MALEISYAGSSRYNYTRSKIPTPCVGPGQADIPFEFMVWTEFSKSLNLLKASIHESVSSEDIHVIVLTAATFDMNMKNLYKKYRKLVHYC